MRSDGIAALGWVAVMMNASKLSISYSWKWTASKANEGVILIAATNRPDVLDPGAVAAGRFDRRVVVPRPDVKAAKGSCRCTHEKFRWLPDVDMRLGARYSGFCRCRPGEPGQRGRSPGGA